MNTIVLLFAGQGAQTIGMGVDVADQFRSAADIFQRASDAIDVDLLDICRQGPEETLRRTNVCQPAILTASIAMLRALEELKGKTFKPMATAGLSLGEYTALVAAGAVEFSTAVKLTHARGRFMQEACTENPGSMYSIIGLDDGDVEQACRQVRDDGEKVWPANYNSPGQVVISGEKPATGRAAAICDDLGARRTIQLNVAGAFHTPLMQPAADQLRPQLSSTTFSSPACPVLANVTGQPLADPDTIQHLLAEQITNPVQWSKSMQWCAREGATQFVEIGPGRVLRGLLRRIDRSLNCASVNNVQSLRQTADTI